MSNYNVPLELVRGDDETIEITFTDENGAPINITGYTVMFTLRANINKTSDTDALLQKNVTSHTNAVGGISAIGLSNSDTNITPGEYYYDVQYKDTSNKIKTVVIGTCTVIQDVTKRTT